jgi:glutamate synthase (ferredoxin)
MIRDVRYHTEFLEAQEFGQAEPEQQAALRTLIEEHVGRSESTLGTRLLQDWQTASKNFVLFTPKPQA